MKFDKKTSIIIVITICLVFLISCLVKIRECEYNNCQKCNKEGLQYYGNEADVLDAPIPYRTVMENIKYPVSNDETDETPIYDTSDKTHNSLLFNKANKQMHFSDEIIMKDLKYFNNSSNLLLEHYLNNNVPEHINLNIQDKTGTIPSSNILSESDISSVNYFADIKFKTETIDKTPPSYLYNYTSERPIEKEKTYIYRLGLDKKGNLDSLLGDADIDTDSGSSVDGGRGKEFGDLREFQQLRRLKEKYDRSKTDSTPTNGLYLAKDVTKIDGVLEENNIYNYDYTLSGMNYDDVYTQLTNYDKSLFNGEVSMTKPGKYSSHYFESNYSDLKDDVTKDFKHFYSTAPTIAGHGLFNKR